MSWNRTKTYVWTDLVVYDLHPFIICVLVVPGRLPLRSSVTQLTSGKMCGLSSTIGFWPTVSIVAHTSLLDSAGDVGFNYLGFEFWATHIHGDLIQRNGDTNYDPSKYKCAQSPSKKLLMKPRLLVTICYMKIYDPGNPGCHSAPGRLRIQCFL